MASNSNKQRRAPDKTTTKTKTQTKSSGKRGRGQPPYAPTPASRQVVELMSAHGIPQADIARAIEPPCDEKTLRKAFAAEIARGRPRYKGQIAQSMNMWLNGRAAQWSEPVLAADGNSVLVPPRLLREEVKPNIAMAIFQAKVVLGQSERVEITGKDGKDLFTPEMLRGLTDAEFAAFNRLLAKAMAAEPLAVADMRDVTSASTQH